MAHLGPLLSAVQQALSMPGVRQRTSEGQWHIEFTEEALLTWLVQQRTQLREEVEQALLDPARDGDGQSPYTEKEAAHARATLLACLIDARAAGVDEVGVSQMLQDLKSRGVVRSRTWAFSSLVRFQDQKLVQYSKSQRRWSLLPGLDEVHTGAT